MFGHWKTANFEVKGRSLVLDKPLIVCDLGQVFFYLLASVSSFVMDICVPVLQLWKEMNETVDGLHSA